MVSTFILQLHRLKAGDGVLFFADGCLGRMKNGFRHHERIAVPRQEEVSRGEGNTRRLQQVI